MKEGLIDEIKSRGYWRVNFQPTIPAIKLEKIGDCKDIVEKNSVSLRGWNFPHIVHQNNETSGYSSFENYYENWTDWQGYKEFWRMYQSGQFISYLSLHEDWYDVRSILGYPNSQNIEPGTKLNWIGSGIYQLTEIYEFLNRLVIDNLYNEGVTVNISLNNTQGRQIWNSDPMRGSLSENYKSGAESILFSKTYSKEEILKEGNDIVIEIMVSIVDKFGWHNPPIEVYRKDRDNLLSGNL